MFFYLENLLKKLLIFTIRVYQKTLSPDHGVVKHFFYGGYCRFHPTCSEYAIQVIKKKGVLKGLLLACWRLLRCNPWNKGGHDPVK
jgi:uncharacterized protein